MDHAAGDIDLAAVVFRLEPLIENSATDSVEGFTPPGLRQSVNPQKSSRSRQARFGQANIAVERLDGAVLKFGPRRGGLCSRRARHRSTIASPAPGQLHIVSKGAIRGNETLLASSKGTFHSFRRISTSMSSRRLSPVFVI